MNKKERSSFDVIIYSMMIVAVIYAVVQTILKNNQELHYKLVLGLWILAAVVLNDFVEPMVTGKFDNIKQDKVKYFLLYAVADAGAYASLYIFVINVNLFKEVMHYIFLAIGVVLFFVKSNIFAGIASDGTQDRERAAAAEPVRKPVCEEEVMDTDDFEVDTLEEDDDLQVFKYRQRK